MSNNCLTSLPEWKALENHQRAFSGQSLVSLFDAQPARQEKFTLRHDGLELDYSKNRITGETIELLCNLAKAQNLDARIQALFSGENVNQSENRPALHMALRGSCANTLIVDDQNIDHAINKTLSQIELFCKEFKAAGRYTDIVHIGIGGSDIGPHLVCNSLSHLAQKGLKLHFLSNIDPDVLAELFAILSPEKTLFIVASKSFTTLETLSNAHSIKNWLKERLPSGQNPAEQFCAVTGNHSAALDFGISKDMIFDLPDWVGGRFSLWSAVGLPIALYLGFDNFKALLDGAKSADTHFTSTPFEKKYPCHNGATRNLV